MNHFGLSGGELACEDVPLGRIAEAVGTPVYVYSTATLERHFAVFRDAFAAHPELGAPLIAYALKANSNVAVVRTLARLGAGADTCRRAEIRRALIAGVPPERIVFSGVGKTADELAFALEAGVAEINVESEPEVDLLARIAAEKGVRAAVAIRVNPEVGAGGPRQDQHRSRPQQVRRLVRRGRAALCEGQQHRLAEAGRRRLPHRQPD